MSFKDVFFSSFFDKALLCGVIHAVPALMAVTFLRIRLSLAILGLLGLADDGTLGGRGGTLLIWDQESRFGHNIVGVLLRNF